VLSSISDDRLKNQEMRQIFGGTYGDSYAGYDNNACGDVNNDLTCMGDCPSGLYCGIVDNPLNNGPLGWEEFKCGCKTSGS
jgi:hypothetical protein